MPSPPPPAPGAEIDTVTITNTEVDANNDVFVVVDQIADKNNANDITIVNTATDPIDYLLVEKFGDNDGQEDVIRIDLSEFSSSFTLDIRNTGNTVQDQLYLEGVHELIDNGDGTFTATYYGTDSNLYTVTILPEDAAVTPYYALDGIVTGDEGGEIMGDGYADTQNDQIGLGDGSADDVIHGNGGSDTIYAGDGNDTIYGDFAQLTGSLSTALPPNASTGAPAGPAAGAEVDTFLIDDLAIDANGQVQVTVDQFADKNNANDVTIQHGGTEAITQIVVEKFGDGDGQPDVIRFDLSTYDDDFIVEIKNSDSVDTLVFEGVHTVTDNGDGTWDLTYIGTDSLVHTVTVLPDNAEPEFYLADTSPYFFDDTIDAGDGADIVDGGFGDDSILGGLGNDSISGGDGSDTIDGGAGDDVIDGDRTFETLGLADTMTYSYAQDINGNQATHFGEEGTGGVDDPLLLIDGDLDTEVRYHADDIIEYDFGQLVSAGTSITLSEGTGVEDGIIHVYVSLGTTDPNGDALSGGGGGVGYENAITNGQSVLIYSGPSDSTIDLIIPIDATHIQFVTEESHAGWAELEFTDLVNAPAPGDDVITGGDGNDVIDAGAGNDSIDGGADADTIDGGLGDDIILGGTGTDSITAGAGNDSVDGGADADVIDGGLGDDIVEGGTGNDTLYGGESEPDVPLERVAFEWSSLPDPNDAPPIDSLDPITSGSQTIGGTTVDFTVTGGAGLFETTTVYTGGIDAGQGSVATNSALGLDGADGVLTMDFSTPVENLQFNLNDFENGSETVVIKAYDAQGNLIPFSVVQGSGISGSDTDAIAGNDTFQGTLTSTGDDSAIGSVGVTIPGPVATLVIDYSQTNGSLTMTDVWFDDPATGIDGGGDDILDGGDGDDILIAGSGTDSMIGGLGTDTYDANTSPELADETIAVTVNGLGNGTVAKTNDATTDTFSGIETFIAGEAAGESDSIVITDAVTKEQVTDISDGAVGVFTPDFGTSGPIAFGGPGEPTINDLLSGTYVDPTHGPIWASGTYQITGGEEDGATVGATSFSNFEQSEFNVVCYAPGSLIRTPSGDKRVEDLRVGDLVETQDAGPCPIRWVRSSDQPLDGAAQDDCPVLIQAGALGDGRPARDLVVSPQHRILVGGHGHLEDRFDEECFVPAKALTGLPKVRHMNGKRAITWVHFALDTHHVVLANGLLSESLYLGPMVVRGLTRDERGALERLFGPMPTDGSALNGPPARPFLTVRQAHRRLTRPARIQPASGQQPQALRA